MFPVSLFPGFPRAIPILFRLERTAISFPFSFFSPLFFLFYQRLCLVSFCVLYSPLFLAFRISLRIVPGFFRALCFICHDIRTVPVFLLSLCSLFMPRCLPSLRSAPYFSYLFARAHSIFSFCLCPSFPSPRKRH